jgi:hypothetical protein
VTDGVGHNLFTQNRQWARPREVSRTSGNLSRLGRRNGCGVWATASLRLTRGSKIALNNHGSLCALFGRTSRAKSGRYGHLDFLASASLVEQLLHLLFSPVKP